MAKQSLAERLKAKRDDLAKGGGGEWSFFIIKVGETRMRPLPVPPDTEFAVEVQYIYLGKELGGFISPATWGNKCAAMEAYNSLSASKDSKDQAIAKKIKPKRKFVMPHIRYNDLKGQEVDTERGEKLLLLTSGQYQDLIDFYLDTDEAGDFTDPATGYDIKYGRTGTGQFDTEYTVRPCKPTKCPKPYGKKVYDPVEMAKAVTPTYEQTQEKIEKYFNLPPEEGEDDSNEERKKKKKKKKDKKKF